MTRNLIGSGAALVLGITLLAGGCGGQTDSSPASPTTANTQDKASFVDTYAAVFCDYLQRCPVHSYFAHPHCVTELRTTLLSLRLWTDPAVHYDPEAGLRCLQALAVHPCSGGSFDDHLASACEWVFAGDGLPGAACSQTGQCQVGLYCRLDAACPGSCKDRPGVNEACGSADCETGLTCHQGTCVPPTPIGGACGPAQPDCAAASICHDDGGGTTTCRANAQVYRAQPVNRVCSTSWQCQTGLYCNQELPVSVCTPQKPRGASCTFYDESCGSGSHCSTATPSTCVPDVALGGACDGPGDLPCAAGTCINGVCAFRGALEAGCARHQECASDYCEGGSCKPMPPCFDEDAD